MVSGSPPKSRPRLAGQGSEIPGPAFGASAPRPTRRRRGITRRGEVVRPAYNLSPRTRGPNFWRNRESAGQTDIGRFVRGSPPKPGPRPARAPSFRTPFLSKTGTEAAEGNIEKRSAAELQTLHAHSCRIPKIRISRFFPRKLQIRQSARKRPLSRRVAHKTSAPAGQPGLPNLGLRFWPIGAGNQSTRTRSYAPRYRVAADFPKSRIARSPKF